MPAQSELYDLLHQRIELHDEIERLIHEQDEIINIHPENEGNKLLPIIRKRAYEDVKMAMERIYV